MNFVQVLFFAGVGLLLFAGLAAIAAYAFHRYGWPTVAVMAVVIGLVVISQENYFETVILFIPLAIGFIGGYCFRNKKSISYYFVAASITLLVAVLGSNYYKSYTEDFTVIDALKVNAQQQIMNSNATDVQKKRSLEDIYEIVDSFIARIIPFLVFIGSVLQIAVCYFFTRMLFLKIDSVEKESRLEYFRINDYTIVALVAGLGTIAFCLLLDKSDWYTLFFIGLNATLVITMLYFIQAMGIIKFFLVKRNFPATVLPLIVLFILSMGKIGFVIFVILAGLGALDLWADFRKLNPVESEKI